MKKNSVSDRDLFIDNDEGGEDDEVVDEEEVGKYRPEEEDGDESDGSDLSSPQHSSRPSSHNTTWPQSYSRLPTAFVTSSFHGKHTPKIISSLIKPLLTTTSAADQQEEVEEGRKSSHSLLFPPPIPTRRPSEKKIHKVSHEPPISRQCSYGQAVLNGINVLCGVGILSMPYAVKEGGWVGLFILLIFAVFQWYTGTLLRYCLDSEPGLETFPDIGQAAFGTTGRFVVSIVLYLELYLLLVLGQIFKRDVVGSVACIIIFWLLQGCILQTS